MDQEETKLIAYQEAINRGNAFEAMIRSEGWGFVKAWYTNKIQMFANSLLLSDKKPIEEFEAERYELIGLRKLMGLIDNDLKILKDSQEDEKAKRSAGNGK